MAEILKTIYYIPDEVEEGAEQTFSPVYFENSADNTLLTSDILGEDVKTVEDALNLIPNKAERPIQYNLTIPTTWSDGVVSLVLEGLSEKSLFIVSVPKTLTKEQYEEFGKCGIVFNNVTVNNFSLRALIETPTIELPIVVTIIEKDSTTPNCITSLPGGTAGLKVQKTAVDGEFDRLESGTLTGSKRLNYNGYLYATRTFGSVYNDYAEFRPSVEDYAPGTVVIMNEEGLFEESNKRLGRVGKIVTDTYGMAIGQDRTVAHQIPVAVSGRVLAHADFDVLPCHIGEPVCSGEYGTVSLMTEEEIYRYPHRIIGIISSIPAEETWGIENININNRIWIEVK